MTPEERAEKAEREARALIARAARPAKNAASKRPLAQDPQTEGPQVTTTTRERPIIFSAPMVRAILSGSKTQTRRVVKPQPQGEPRPLIEWSQGVARACHDHNPDGAKLAAHAERLRGRIFPFAREGVRGLSSPRCPYGAPGDVLWVRETWIAPFKRTSTNNGCSYLADYGHRIDLVSEAQARANWSWRSPVLMPRWASRLSLRVTDVRVQRLQEISGEDAKAEGVQLSVTTDRCPPGKVRLLLNISSSPLPNEFSAKDPNDWSEGDFWRHEFAHAWNEINGKRAPWASNPWVFAVTFERIGDPK